MLYLFVGLLFCSGGFCPVYHTLCVWNIYLFNCTAGTQTSLTFPTTFDLERLLQALTCHAHDDALEGSESGQEVGGADDSCRDLLGNSLCRKLFGQPERQVFLSHLAYFKQRFNTIPIYESK